MTDDAALADACEQARADGRRWTTGTPAVGFPDLSPGGTTQGHNHCLTEIQAAILSASLPDLDRQNRTRAAAVSFIEEEIASIEGVEVLRRRGDPRVDTPTFWHVPIKVDSTAFGGRPAEDIRRAVSSLVGLYLEPVGLPIPRSPLYRPQLYERFPLGHRTSLACSDVHLPVSEQLAETCFTVPHHALLAPHRDLTTLVETIQVVQAAARRMVDW